MPELNDHELLVEFAGQNSEAAFAELVRRYVNLVYSVAVRKTGNTHTAEEVTQAVFLILAKKAGSLSRGRRHEVLAGWLCETARLTAANHLRGEIRRQKREQEAYMQSLVNEAETDETWQQIAPLLDDAVGKLNPKERNAVVLRFFENRSLVEVGQALGASEDAAKMRVTRAVEKLRRFFSKRGMTFSVAAIAGAVALNSVQGAPVGMVSTVTATAATGTTVSATLTALVKGTMKTMTWLKWKFAAGAAAGLLLAGGAATVALSSDSAPNDGLAANDIFEKAREVYAAMTSYSDEGTVVADIGSTTIKTTFTINLQRPNLYRIQWVQRTGSTDYQSQPISSAVWCAGAGDFLQMGASTNKNGNKEMALASATGISGSASATVPGTFFQLNWGNQLGTSTSTRSKRQADEKIGGIECYVVASELKGHTTTLWIGKQDYLIHQKRTVTSVEAMKAALAEAAKRYPEIADRASNRKVFGSTSTEMHNNIVVIPALAKADFEP